MLKSFFYDLKFYFFIKVSISLFFLLSLKIYTNILSVAEYGNYAILLFIITSCSVLMSSWLSASLIRYYPEYQKNSLQLYNNIISFLLVTLCCILPIIGLCFVLVKKFIIYDLKLSEIIASMLQISMQTIFLVFCSTYSAERSLKKLSTYSLSQVSLGFLLSLILLKLSITKLTAIMAGNVLSYSVISWLVFKDKLAYSYCFEIDRILLRKVLGYGLPLLLFNVLAYILISSDQLILKYYNCGEQLGAYAANYTLIDKSLTVMTGLITVTYTPILFQECEANGMLAAYAFFKKILYIYLPISLTIIAIFFVGYREISMLILPAKYAIPDVIPYIVMGSYFLNITNIFSEIFTLNKKNLLLACCYIFPAIISIVGNIFFVPIYAVQATAYMTFLSYFILMVSVISCAFYLMHKSKYSVL